MAERLLAENERNQMQQQHLITSANYSIAMQKRRRKMASGGVFLSSAVSSALVALFSTPFDVIRIRVQGLNQQNMGSITRQNATNLKVMRHLLTTEGFISLYSGFNSNLISVCPSNIIYMNIYQNMKDHLINRYPENQNFAISLSGICARLVTVSVIAPIELVRTLKMSKKVKYGTINGVFTTKLGSEGIKVLYVGLAPSLLRDLPFSMIYWPMFERLNNKMNERDGSRQFLNSFLSASLAGMVCTLLTQPFDALKTFKQTSVLSNNNQSPSLTNITSSIFSKSRFKGFYAGLWMRLIKVPISCAVMISSYGYFQRLFTG